jgi:uncharacterized membrane protein YccC
MPVPLSVFIGTMEAAMSDQKKDRPAPPAAAANEEQDKPSFAEVSRGMTTRRLLSARQLQESLAVAPPPSPRIAAIAGLQAALAVLAAVSLVHFSPWPHLVGFPALGALAALFGRYASLTRRKRIVGISAFLLTLSVFIPTLASLAGTPFIAKMFLLAVLAGAATLAVAHWRLGGPGAVIFLFAAGAALAPVDSWQTVIERTAATAAGGAVAWLICMLTDRLRSAEMENLSLPASSRRPFGHEWIGAIRIALGAAIAALIAHAAGWQYPAWAAIGATAVMQGGHLHVTMNRALQRMAGTIVGAFLAWAILAQSPPFWMLLAAVVIFQFVTEVVIGYNYALGQITVTPMALLMTYMTSPAAAASMPVERVFDTILGATLGIVFAVIFSTLDDRVYLARHRDG